MQEPVTKMDARLIECLRFTTLDMTGKFPNGLGIAMLKAGKGPTELARAIGVTKQDISRWGKQERKLPPAVANKLAPLLNTTASALLFIDAHVSDEFRTVVALSGYVGAGGEIDYGTEQVDPDLSYEAGIFAALPDAAIAYEVMGDSMRPRLLPGNLIVCSNYTQNIDDLIGEEVVCGVEGEGRLLKILHPGSKTGAYHLESHNAPLMLDVVVKWVAEIVAIIPARKWRKLQRSNLPVDWGAYK